MDILFFILAAYGLFVIGSLLAAALSDALPRSGKKRKKSEKDFYMWLAEGFDRRNRDETKSNQRWVEEHFKE